MRKQPQPPASTATAAPTPSTRASRSSHVEPQMEASNGVPLVDKTSRKRTATVETPPRPNKATAASKLATRPTSPIPSRDDELFKLLKNEFEALRQLITCTICYGLLYEPYTTHCGHTFCYSCLCKSFSEDHARLKSCPACRTAIKHAPAEVYLLRDITQSFTKHTQLLGPDETLDQHEQARKEQRAAVLKDKNNKHPRTGGLFKGFFNVRLPRQTLRAWQDPEDGVDRCLQCMWELVDGLCEHCGQDYGSTPAAYFSGYSETGDSSEYAHNDDFAEFLDPDVDMEYDDFEEDDPGDWFDERDQFSSEVDRTYALRRYFGNTSVPPPAVVMTRSQRLAPHSAAGGRRRSGPAPLSEMMESEMGSIMEEDEDEEGIEEDEDTSMDGFIRDESSESQSQSSASASEQAPQPRASRAVANTPRASSLSSTDEGGSVVRPGRIRASGRQGQAVSQGVIGRQNQRRPTQEVREPPQPQAVNENVQVDEEDELPIAHGRPRPASQRGPVRNMRRRRNVVRDPSEEADWGYTPLNRQANDDAEGDEGSDRTVGWEPTTISNDRARNGGSLTPTADRPHPLQRPISRTGISALPPGARGLRRRSSVLSNSTRHYEDNDADDDGSDGNVEGGNAVSRPPLRQRGSRIRIMGTNIADLPAATAVTNGDMDSEESDLSERSPRSGVHAGRRPSEYDPRISFIFASMQEFDNGGEEDIGMNSDAIQQLRGLARTPIARPRTANRNRPSHNGVATAATVNSPGSVSRQAHGTAAAARFRPPVADRIQPARVEERGPLARAMPPETSNGNTTLAAASNPSPFASNRIIGESIQRPPSRLPSGLSAVRRNPGEVPVQDSFQGTYMPPGLHPARVFQSQNPFYTHNLRPRPSTQRLQNQPSNATLRSRQSARALRNQQPPPNPRAGVIQTSQVRPQASRINIRNENSAPRLTTQTPTRNVRAMNTASSPPTNVDRQASFAPPSSAGGGFAGANGLAQSPMRQMVESPSSASSTSTSNPFLRMQRQTATAGPSAAPREDNPRATTIFRPSYANQGSTLAPPSRAVAVEIPENAAAARRRSGPVARAPIY